MDKVAGIVFFTAWLLCGCCVETIVDEPGAGIIFLIALVICILAAIVMDRTDL